MSDLSLEESLQEMMDEYAYYRSINADNGRPDGNENEVLF